MPALTFNTARALVKANSRLPKETESSVRLVSPRFTAAPCSRKAAAVLAGARHCFRAEIIRSDKFIAHARKQRSRLSAVPQKFQTVANAEAQGLSVKTVKKPNCRVELEVTVSKEVLELAYENTLKSLRGNGDTKFKGFRKGTVPDEVLINSAGVQQVKMATLEGLFHSVLPQALSTLEGPFFDDTEAIESDVSDLLKSLEGKSGRPSSGCQFTVSVDVYPEVKYNSALEDIAITVSEVSDDATNERTVDALLASKRRDYATLRVASDRGLEKGDVAIVDIRGVEVGPDGALGEEIPSVTTQGWNLDTAEEQHLLPGLVAGLEGMRPGDDARTLALTFPDNWSKEELRGKDAQYTVSMKELFWRELPEEDAELAQQIVPGATSMEQVRSMYLEEEGKRTAEALENKLRDALVEAVVATTECDLPESQIQRQGEQNYFLGIIGMMQDKTLPAGKANAEELMQPELVQNYIDGQREEIAQQVKVALVVDDLRRAQGLQVEDFELNAEVANVQAEFEAMGQEYDDARLQEQARENIEAEKVVEYLKKTCNVTVLPYEPERKGPKQGSDDSVVFNF